MKSLTGFFILGAVFGALLESKNPCSKVRTLFATTYECDGEEPIGEGGFGKIFSVTRPGESTRLALKVQEFPPVTEPEDLSNYEYIKAQAKQEYRVLGLCSHKNVIGLVEKIDLPEGVAAVMEYAEGGDLENLLEKKWAEEFGPKHPKRILEVFQGILEGVSHIHRVGYVHRDLKPNNVMFKNGEVKVIDLGMAVAKNSNQVLVSGDPNYIDPMAPKIGNFKFVWTPASDVYNLGIILYYMTFKKFPYTNKGGASECQFQLALQSPVIKLPAGTEQTIAYLISNMILLDPASRISIGGALLVTQSFLKSGRVRPLAADIALTNKKPIDITEGDVLRGGLPERNSQEDLEGTSDNLII